MTVQSSIIMRLIAQIEDPKLRELIRDQYYLDVEANANAAQVAFIDMIQRHEQREKRIEDRVNSIYTMSQEGGEAIRQLQSDFQSTLEVVSNLSIDIQDIQKVIKDHSADIDSFKESRDQSISERKMHSEGLRESKEDRARINETISSMGDQIRDMVKSIDDLRREVRLKIKGYDSDS